MTSVTYMRSLGILPKENKLCRIMGDGADQLHLVLSLPWTHTLIDADPHPMWKMKCLCVQVLSKMGCTTETGINLKVLDFALQDEVVEVRTEAVVSMPIFCLRSGIGILTHLFKRLQ